jgi:outer membrane lipoprotein SlyB
MAALGGVALGATAGGIAGGLIGMGIPELEAKVYEGKIHGGNILISVHTDDGDQISRAKDIFSRARATDICSSSDSSAPA